MEFNWEQIASKPQTSRARVFGGWLVKVCDSKEYSTVVFDKSSLVFIPDPKHCWTINRKF
jgi:hypothetical protein